MCKYIVLIFKFFLCCGLQFVITTYNKSICKNYKKHLKHYLILHNFWSRWYERHFRIHCKLLKRSQARRLRQRKPFSTCSQPQIPRSEPQQIRPKRIPPRSEDIPIRSKKLLIRWTTPLDTFIRSPVGLQTSPMRFLMHPDTLPNLSRQVKDTSG